MISTAIIQILSINVLTHNSLGRITSWLNIVVNVQNPELGGRFLDISFEQRGRCWAKSSLEGDDMRHASFVLLSSFIFFSIFCRAHETQVQQTMPVSAQRDPQSVAILMQSLTAAGGPQAKGSLHDFEGTGTITYFVSGQEVRGSVTLKGRGYNQFRMDAQLPHGRRSIVLDGGRGKINDVQGAPLDIPSITVNSVGNLTYPYLVIGSFVENPDSRIAYIGTTEIRGRPVYEIRVMRPTADRPDPRMRLTLDYFVDKETYLVLRVADSTHLAVPASNFPHAIDYDEYRAVNGLEIPMRVSETYMDSVVWNLHLREIRFNTGLTDSHFALD
jgi:hypothetical protein